MIETILQTLRFRNYLCYSSFEVQYNVLDSLTWADKIYICYLSSESNINFSPIINKCFALAKSRVLSSFIQNIDEVIYKCIFIHCQLLEIVNSNNRQFYSCSYLADIIF